MIILVCSWLRRVGNASQGVSIYFMHLICVATNLYWCVLGLCVSFERSQPFVEILKLVKEQLQQKIFSLSADNFLASQKHFDSPSRKPSCIEMTQHVHSFWTAKHIENTVPILTAKSQSFVWKRKKSGREGRLTCRWRNVSDILISSSFACHSHQIFSPIQSKI